MLKRLQGAELAQVWFVRDYLQLIFEDEPTSWSLQCWVWPRVRVGADTMTFGQPAYRDSLCGLIGEEVVSTKADRGLALQFVGADLVIDPSFAELRAPEIAMLHVLWGDELTVWCPGDKPFDHLG